MSEPITIDTAEGRIKRLRQSVITRARIIDHGAGKNLQPWMFTLTYREVDAWQARHISDFLKRLRQWVARRGLPKMPYVWVAELQKRGAVHYHVLAWLPKSWRLSDVPKPDTMGWWPHGLTQRERARNAVGYLAKYVSKGSLSSEMKFPPGCRLHGGGGISLRAAASVRWWLLPSYMRAAVSPASDVRRKKGGGFISRATGQIWAAVFGICRVGRGRVTVVQIAEPPPPRQPRPSSCPSWLDALLGLDGFSCQPV